VVTIAKTSALAISVGDRLFWDATNKVVNKTTTAQQQVGIAVEAAANPSSTVSMLLDAGTPGRDVMTEAEMLRRLSRHSSLRVLSAVWTPTGGQATAITGYFKDDSDVGNFVEDASPTLEVAASMVPGVLARRVGVVRPS
jgi:hypothetical protein